MLREPRAYKVAVVDAEIVANQVNQRGGEGRVVRSRAAASPPGWHRTRYGVAQDSDCSELLTRAALMQRLALNAATHTLALVPRRNPRANRGRGRPKGGVVFVEKSKTEQERHGEKVPTFFSSLAKDPLRSLDTLLAASGIVESAILRRHGRRQQPGDRLSPAAVSDRERHYAKLVRLAYFGTHSLRSGFITTAVRRASCTRGSTGDEPGLPDGSQRFRRQYCHDFSPATAFARPPS